VDARTGRGNTPLMSCASGGFVDCAELVLTHGADVNAVGDLDGDTPLHRLLAILCLDRHGIRAVKEGHAPMVRVLVQHGARLDIRNNDNLTPVRTVSLSMVHAPQAMLADQLKKPDVVQALSGV